MYNIIFIPWNTKFYFVIPSYVENPTDIDVELASHSILQKNITLKTIQPATIRATHLSTTSVPKKWLENELKNTSNK